MKKHITLLILTLAGLTSCASVAQFSKDNSKQKYPDGIYYKPDPELIAARLQQNEEVQELVLKTQDTLIVPDNMAVKITFDKDLTTATLFRADDLYWGSGWGFRFSPFYDYWYMDRWAFHRWYDPWYYNSWSWRYGWYDPWFYGGFSWGFGFYDPWFYGGIGWYNPWFYGGIGWYDPWYSPWYGPVYPGHDFAFGRRGVYQPSGAGRVIDHAIPGRATGGAASRPAVNRTVTSTGGAASRPASNSKMTPVKRTPNSSGAAVSRVASAVSANVPGTNANTGSTSNVRKPASNTRTIMSSGNNSSGQNRTVSRTSGSEPGRPVTRSSSHSGGSTTSVPRSTGGGYSGGGYSGGGAGGARSTGGGGGIPSRR